MTPVTFICPALLILLLEFIGLIKESGVHGGLLHPSTPADLNDLICRARPKTESGRTF
jgi:hypothetical protein